MRMYCRSGPRSSSSRRDVSTASHRAMVPLTEGGQLFLGAAEHHPHHGVQAARRRRGQGRVGLEPLTRLHGQRGEPGPRLGAGLLGLAAQLFFDVGPQRGREHPDLRLGHQLGLEHLTPGPQRLGGLQVLGPLLEAGHQLLAQGVVAIVVHIGQHRFGAGDQPGHQPVAEGPGSHHGE